MPKEQHLIRMMTGAHVLKCSTKNNLRKVLLSTLRQNKISRTCEKKGQKCVKMSTWQVPRTRARSCFNGRDLISSHSRWCGAQCSTQHAAPRLRWKWKLPIHATSHSLQGLRVERNATIRKANHLHLKDASENLCLCFSCHKLPCILRSTTLWFETEWLQSNARRVTIREMNLRQIHNCERTLVTIALDTLYREVPHLITFGETKNVEKSTVNRLDCYISSFWRIEITSPHGAEGLSRPVAACSAARLQEAWVPSGSPSSRSRHGRARVPRP